MISYRVVFPLLLLSALAARAERGVFAASLSAGQAVSVAPGPGTGRGVPIVGELDYGLSERWSSALAVGVELVASPTLTLSLGPHLTVLRTDWWTIDLLAVPEALWLVPARLDLGVRVGVSFRYQLMWGVGLGLEVSVRGRTPATGAFTPSLQGLIVGGLSVEA